MIIKCITYIYDAVTEEGDKMAYHHSSNISSIRQKLGLLCECRRLKVLTLPKQQQQAAVK